MSRTGDQRFAQRFRGGLVLTAHRLCASLNSRLESCEEEEKKISVSLIRVAVAAHRKHRTHALYKGGHAAFVLTRHFRPEMIQKNRYTVRRNPPCP